MAMASKLRFIVLTALVLAGCTRAAPDATPEGALRAWLEHMEAAQDDPHEAREAYRLLGPASRENLAQRAERASQLQGRRTEPYEIVAPGFFGLRFRPEAMKATVVGDRASVEVTGNHGSERATVACVREGGGWRVELDLPPLPQAAGRRDGGA